MTFLILQVIDTFPDKLIKYSGIFFKVTGFSRLYITFCTILICLCSQFWPCINEPVDQVLSGTWTFLEFLTIRLAVLLLIEVILIYLIKGTNFGAF